MLEEVLRAAPAEGAAQVAAWRALYRLQRAAAVQRVAASGIAVTIIAGMPTTTRAAVTP